MSPVAVRLWPEVDCMLVPDRELGRFGDRDGDKGPLRSPYKFTALCVPSIAPLPLTNDVCDDSCESGAFWSGFGVCEFSSKRRGYPVVIARLLSSKDDEGKLGKESVKVLADWSSGR